MANRKACEASIGELDFLSIEQALAYLHMGETRFNEKVRPEVNNYPNGTYYKQELKKWMIDHVVVNRIGTGI